MWPFGTVRAAHEPYMLELFPLKTVLFPGGRLPLKVFEQRYIEMTKDSLANHRPFGVSLIIRGDEVAATRGKAPEIATVGTLARITDWDMPELGILHLATHGEGRFQVRSHSVQPSGRVVGEVTPIPVEPSKPLADEYAPLAKLLELIATRVGPQNFPTERDYDDASWVGYRLAEVLPLPLSIKQSMLEINDSDVRLQVLRKFLLQQGLL
ncbi:MAG: LON peptidase substrate-binding domain-containing protein [Burkholderiales bacterium]|nr:LON peptidase substrate-binding domain-containing protein [Burkholderiales bacterium]